MTEACALLNSGQAVSSFQGDCFTPRLLRFSSALIQQVLLVGTLLPFFPYRTLIDNFRQESDVTSLQDQIETYLKVFL